jgi:tRNA nucleotidyltransferase (CCA-adding enzyme)
MREHASSVALVSGERIGGGLAADGMGELSKLLLGREPRKALRLARDTGVLGAIVPEFEPAIGFDVDADDHSAPLDEHIFAVVEAAADAGATLRVRLAALFHDLGRPRCKGGESHAERGARIAAAVMRRLRYPNTLREWVVGIVRFHPVELDELDEHAARRLLARHGDGLAFELLDHWHADLAGRDQSPAVTTKLSRLAAFRLVVEQELESPHRLADLAVDGSDLLELGYEPGPALGRTLRELLDEVVEEPALNERETLLARAEELRSA